MVSINILWDARIWLIFWIFSSTCFCDHQLSRDFEFLRKITSSSNDSTNGAPSVSGNHNASSAEVKLAAPKISRGSSLKVIMGRYRATLKIDDIYNVDYATKYSIKQHLRIKDTQQTLYQWGCNPSYSSCHWRHAKASCSDNSWIYFYSISEYYIKCSRTTTLALKRNHHTFYHEK